jgi:hypothetical protein
MVCDRLLILGQDHARSGELFKMLLREKSGDLGAEIGGLNETVRLKLMTGTDLRLLDRQVSIISEPLSIIVVA